MAYGDAYHHLKAPASDQPCAFPTCPNMRSAGKYDGSRYCPEHRHAAHRAQCRRMAEAEAEREAGRRAWEAVWIDAKTHADAAWERAEVSQLVITPTGGYFAAAGAVGHAWVVVRHIEFGTWLRHHRGAEAGLAGGASFPAPEGPLARQQAWVNAFASRLQAQGIRAYPDSRLG
jgi:hypothetical protein